MKPHKHAELIKAWADGNLIEYRLDGSYPWSVTDNPNWEYVGEFRIKPAPKPDVHIYAAAFQIGGDTSLGFREGGEVGANLRLTFDGETGKLKAAQVLK